MQLKVSKIRLQTNEDGQAEIILTTKENPLKVRQEVTGLKEKAKDKEIDVELKVYRKKRSLDANGYLWVICQKIAEVIKDGRTTKEDIYREAIRKVGQFETLPIKSEAVGRWLMCWSGKGIGWFAEVLQDSKLHGYKNIRSYYGSSVYDTREMSVLIDYLIEEAKEQGIETMTPAEIESLKQSWGKQGKVS